MAVEQGQRADPPLASPQPPGPGDATGLGRGSRILGNQSAGARSIAIAVVSTVVFVAILAFAVVHAPGWDEVRKQFFDGGEFADTFPAIGRAFGTNVKLFCLAEILILAVGLLLAVLRSLPGPALFPLRAFSVVYTDVFRGVPTILVVYLLGFGVPALQVAGIPKSVFFWGLVALVLVYSAYVAEVYRAGIQSVHTSQEAAARSLGLTQLQTLRYVVVPQAVRRVIPPLLNDFIGLQKDTALIALLGTVEAFRQSQIDASASFNFTPYVATALIFILLTIPLARLTDWLVARDRRRQLAGRAS